MEIGCPEAIVDDRIWYSKNEAFGAFDKDDRQKFHEYVQAHEHAEIEDMYRNYGFIAEEFSYMWDTGYKPVTAPPFYKGKINDISRDALEEIRKREAAWNRAHGR